ncbi:MAG: hypothetical protein ABSD99_04870 [Candidatus Bathyarchaeia archaeon]|jgi:hypothetical protein
MTVIIAVSSFVTVILGYAVMLTANSAEDYASGGLLVIVFLPLGMAPIVAELLEKYAGIAS